MKDKGILTGTDGDLLIVPEQDRHGIVVSGLKLGNSLYQNQYILLKAHKGELKEYPALGAGVSDMQHEHDLAGWTTRIREQLEKDGMRVNKVAFDVNMNLEIDAAYENP